MRLDESAFLLALELGPALFAAGLRRGSRNLPSQATGFLLDRYTVHVHCTTVAQGSFGTLQAFEQMLR